MITFVLIVWFFEQLLKIIAKTQDGSYKSKWGALDFLTTIVINIVIFYAAIHKLYFGTLI